MEREKLAKEFSNVLKNLQKTQIFSYQEQKELNDLKKETMIFNVIYSIFYRKKKILTHKFLHMTFSYR